MSAEQSWWIVEVDGKSMLYEHDPRGTGPLSLRARVVEVIERPEPVPSPERDEGLSFEQVAEIRETWRAKVEARDVALRQIINLDPTSEAAIVARSAWLPDGPPASASVSDGKLDELRATVDGWDEEALERRDKFPLGHPKAMLHEEVARAYRRVSGEVDRLARKADPVAPAPRGDAEGHSYVLDDSASCRWCGRPRVDAERVTLVRWRGKGWQQTAPENRPKYEATAARLPGSVEVAEFVRLDPAPVSADDSTEGDG